MVGVRPSRRQVLRDSVEDRRLGVELQGGKGLYGALVLVLGAQETPEARGETGPPQAHDPPDLHPADSGSAPSTPTPTPASAEPSKGLASPPGLPPPVEVGGLSQAMSQGSAQQAQAGLPQGVDSEGPSCPGWGLRIWRAPGRAQESRRAGSQLCGEGRPSSRRWEGKGQA